MCDWIVSLFADVPPPFHSLALALYRFLSSVPSRLPPLPPAPSAPAPPEQKGKERNDAAEEEEEDQEAEEDENPRAKKRGRTSTKTATAKKKPARKATKGKNEAAAVPEEVIKRDGAALRRREMEEDRQREKELVIEPESEDERINILTQMIDAHGTYPSLPSLDRALAHRVRINVRLACL
jgi:hypothetical protein